jgi:sugar phosphate isomerase/epimerase
MAMRLSRRVLLAAAPAALLRGKTLSTIGVQLYTVRNVITEKPAETLKALDEIGFRETEVVARDMDKIWASLQQTKLKPVSVHLDTSLFMKDKDKLPAALDDAAKRGFKYVVCPYIAPADRGGVDVIRKLAATLNEAGQRCKTAGLTLAYHNHAFEFEPAGSGTLLDVLMAESDRKLVQLELDIMWSQVAGVSPVVVLEKYSGRIPLMHVKNVAQLPTQYHEKVPKEAFKEAGNGVIDIPGVLKAGQKAGVKHFIVEQDQTPGDPVASLRESYQYLRKLSF